MMDNTKTTKDVDCGSDKTLEGIPNDEFRSLEDWDKVRCIRCGKVISMFDADTINGHEYFVCKGLRCGR